jgi:hypothetical protein
VIPISAEADWVVSARDVAVTVIVPLCGTVLGAV